RDRDTHASPRLPTIVESRAVEITPRQIDAVASAPKSGRRIGLNRRTLIAGAAALAIIAGGGVGTQWRLSTRYIVSTDDPYVRAHNTTLASKISGYVESIPVDDNARVHAGDVIATIDN